ncbi:MAG: T9SS type A sorting domain-containing protein, partial [Flammeovirgaceae bacterium]|nr:T9SS type A sorting domain-containing protein [Flammeovirgaceae bacterium]
FRVRPKGSSTWTYSGRVSTTSVTFNLPAGLYEWEVMANLFGAPTTCFSNWKKGNDVVVNAPSGSSTRETWNDLSTADVLADNIEFVNLGTKEETFVDGLDQTSLLLVYPNPTKDVVSIQIGNISGKGNLAIYNVVGELIHQQEVHSGQLVKDFSLEKYPRGVYIVRLTSSGETNTCKFVLE